MMMGIASQDEALLAMTFSHGTNTFNRFGRISYSKS